jgi:hypothetical protein
MTLSGRDSVQALGAFVWLNQGIDETTPAGKLQMHPRGTFELGVA